MANTIRVLFIDDSSDHVQRVTTALRNGGYAVREHQLTEPDELQDRMHLENWDFILFSPGHSACDTARVAAEFATPDLDAAPLILGEVLEPQAQIDALRRGAKDYVLRDNIDHLLLVIRREYASLTARRELRELQTLKRESEERVLTLLDNTRDAIGYIHEGMHISSNTTYQKLFGYENGDDLLSVPIMDLIAAEEHGRFKTLLRDINQGKQIGESQEFQAVRADGSQFDARLKFAAASIDGEPCMQVLIEDLSENDALLSLTKQDLLTGLVNRQYFIEELAGLLIREDRPGDAHLLFFRLDNFDAIKDRIGIACCDLLLRDIASELRNAMPPEALAARFGDEVFSVLFHNNEDRDAVIASAEKLRAVIEKTIFDVDGKSIETTCSVGIIPIEPADSALQDILSSAENSCNAAKTAGGNRVHIADRDVAAQFGLQQEQQTYWNIRIEDALANNRLRLSYHPIVSLHAEPGERYEVLLRMLGEKKEEIMPRDFLPAARGTNLMPALDQWVIKQAISVVAARRRAGRQTTLFIKVAAESLKAQELPTWISNYLKAARLPGDGLVFQVSEEIAVANLKEVKLFAEGIRQLRCGFAIEHTTGSGHHGFGYLKHLPADYLKIAGSFVSQISGNTEKRAVVKEIASYAQANKKQTIAEFVQDANTLAILWQLGVNFVQGYYLQQPDAAMNYDFSSN